MNPETLKALQDSIERWERLANSTPNKGESIGPGDCPLCARFHLPVGERALKCIGCPVMDKTGKQFCYDTPFIEVENIADSDRWENDAQLFKSEEFIIAAEKELEFLKSLLPA